MPKRGQMVSPNVARSQERKGVSRSSQGVGPLLPHARAAAFEDDSGQERGGGRQHGPHRQQQQRPQLRQPRRPYVSPPARRHPAWATPPPVRRTAAPAALDGGTLWIGRSVFCASARDCWSSEEDSGSHRHPQHSDTAGSSLSQMINREL